MWRKSSAKRKRSDYHSNLWEEIGLKVGHRGVDCRKRFTLLKRRYLQYKKNYNPTSSAAQAKRRSNIFPFAAQMSFLDENAEVFDHITESMEAIEGTSAGPEATSTGPEATSTGPEATSIGPEATSTGPEATSIGPEATSTGPEATSTGPEATSTGPEAHATDPDKNIQNDTNKNPETDPEILLCNVISQLERENTPVVLEPPDNSHGPSTSGSEEPKIASGNPKWFISSHLKKTTQTHEEPSSKRPRTGECLERLTNTLQTVVNQNADVLGTFHNLAHHLIQNNTLHGGASNSTDDATSRGTNLNSSNGSSQVESENIYINRERFATMFSEQIADIIKILILNLLSNYNDGEVG
uniref:MADF domain-containing protein n=1 Tax=Lutzomyia longipalpis TaxID=7200 RepID=A0A1B0CMG1_LUTLO